MLTEVHSIQLHNANKKEESASEYLSCYNHIFFSFPIKVDKRRQTIITVSDSKYYANIYYFTIYE